MEKIELLVLLTELSEKSNDKTISKARDAIIAIYDEFISASEDIKLLVDIIHLIVTKGNIIGIESTISCMLEPVKQNAIRRKEKWGVIR